MATVGLDEEAVTGWITGLGINAVAPLDFRRIGNGQSNLTYLVTDATGAKTVLRRPPLGALLASAHDVEREHKILSALQTTAVPVPKVLGLNKDSSDGAPLMLVSHVDGVVVDTVESGSQLNSDQRERIGLSMPRTLALIHGVDLDASGLADLASRKPYAERQLKRWSGQWAKSKTRESAGVDQLAERLSAAIPEQREVTLVHGDFHLANVIADVDGDIAAVLDWELCTLGDPLADLGTLLTYWPEASDKYAGPFMASTLPGFPSRAELVSTYADATSRNVSAVGFWHTLGLWKLAIIAEGVYRRALNDSRNRTGTIDLSPAMVDQIIASALATADRYNL